ncbi:MAG: putative Ig domain-containing protein [bacterium]|nr:putative Ig domain-containing protein [bacterium]
MKIIIISFIVVIAVVAPLHFLVAVASDSSSYTTATSTTDLYTDPCAATWCYPYHDNSEYQGNDNANGNQSANQNTNINTNTNQIYINIYGNGTVTGSNIDVRSLPTCNNGLDDDDDGRIDYNDSDCKVSGKENGRNARLNTSAPIFTSIAPTQAREGVTYVYDADARDNDGDTLTYALTQNPAGVSIDHQSGLIRWTPNSLQSGFAHAVTVEVSDGARQATQSFQIFVEKIIVREVASRSTASTGRVAGARVVAVAEAAEQNTLRAYNIRVDTDEEQNSIVTWDTTKPSRGHVIFGLASRGDKTGIDFTGAAQYEFESPDSVDIATSHRVMLGQLESERVYYFRVVASAGTENYVSSERSFVQLPSGETLRGDGGFASVIGTLGAFLISPWFLLLVIIIITLVLFLRRRNRQEIIAHAPVETKVSGGHH